MMTCQEGIREITFHLLHFGKPIAIPPLQTSSIMKKNSFTIQYQDKFLTVHKIADANEQVFYTVQFPNGTESDLYITPKLDGMAPAWAEGSGEKTVKAREIGELIEQFEKAEA